MHVAAEAAPRAVETLESLYRAHSHQVARWAARLAGPSSDIEDLVHEVFLVVERRLPEFRGDAQITTWLYRITAHVVRHDRRRHRWRRYLGIDVPERVCERPSPADAAEHRQRVAQVYAVLDRMKEKYRTVLILFEIEGLSGPEIAALTGVSPETVWVRLHRARKDFVRRADKAGVE